MDNKKTYSLGEIFLNTTKIQKAMDIEDWDLTRQLKELKELIFLKALSREAAISLKKLRDKTITSDEWTELAIVAERITEEANEMD